MSILRAYVLRLSRTITNIENVGKTVSTGPIKPNQPIKKIGELNKSFLLNTEKALQSTRARQVFTPQAINAGLIYNDDDEGAKFDELKFTKPKYTYDNYHSDMLDCLPKLEPMMSPKKPPPPTPPPPTPPPPTPPPGQMAFSMEFDNSYEDDFFTDDFSYDNIPEFDRI